MHFKSIKKIYTEYKFHKDLHEEEKKLANYIKIDENIPLNKEDITEIPQTEQTMFPFLFYNKKK